MDILNIKPFLLRFSKDNKLSDVYQSRLFVLRLFKLFDYLVTSFVFD